MHFIPIYRNYRCIFHNIMVKLTEITESLKWTPEPRIDEVYFYYTYSNVNCSEPPECGRRLDSNKPFTKLESKVALIQEPMNQHPMELFDQWLKDAEDHTSFHHAHSMNLSTVSESGNVSSRVVVMTDIEKNVLHFQTSRSSPKYKDIEAHPQVALTFHWTYKDKGEMVSRQVRVEGIAKEKDRVYNRKAFDKSSIANKFRNCLCHQSEEIDWSELKQRHDDLLERVNEKKVQLNMPDHAVSFGVIPHRVEFYHSIMDGTTIPDRLLFKKEKNDDWSQVHLEA